MGSIAYRLPQETLERTAERRQRRSGLALVTLLALFAFAVNGFHPYTEDGGLYLAGVRHLLDRSLYPHDLAFVTAPTRFSGFAPLIAALIRLTRMPEPGGIETVTLALHLATIWGTLWGAWLLASRCFQTGAARAGSVLLFACWLGLPVAGTSLLLMDPYLTARSFSTPCLLFALLGTLYATAPEDRLPTELPRRRLGASLWIASILIATLLHPLMAAYAVEASVILAWVRVSRGRARWLGIGLIALAVLGATAGLNLLAGPESPDYPRIALSRPYWFLPLWHWYELAGIAGPVLILLPFRHRTAGHPADSADLVVAAIAATLMATATSLLFVHPHAATHLIARLQPMRELQFVYLTMLVILGAWVGENLLRDKPWRWILSAVLLAGPLYLGSRVTTPHSRHLELPGRSPTNQWVQAFEWIRDHTPRNALFALYPDYVQSPGEDAQCFRPIALRSVLPDYSKDGGEASIDPQLTAAWSAGQAAQRGLATEDDAARRSRLEPLGVSWVVLGAEVRTGLDCPYRNSAVAVCRLR